jgi:hypothetical protein
MPSVLLLAGGLALCATTPGFATEAFDVQTLNTNIVWWPSLAIDGGGTSHLAYFYARGADNTSGVVYQSRQGGVWTPPEIVSNNGAFVSMALDAAQSPHVAYYGYVYSGIGQPTGAALYASRESGSWTTETIDALDSYAYGTMSLAFDPEGRPHVAYVGSGDVLRHAVRDQGTWVHEAVAGEFTYEPGASLTIDSRGEPWISYHRDFTVQVAHRSAGKWVIETLSTTAAQYLATSLALDRDNQPMVAYFDNGSFALRLATRVGGTWTSELVDAAGGDNVSLATDGAGQPHLSYREGANRSLEYAHRVDGAWSISPVDGTPGAGMESSIAIDRSGYPEIAFKFKRPYAGGGALRYAIGPQGVLGIGDPGAGAHVSLAVTAPNPSSDGAAEFAL